MVYETLLFQFFFSIHLSLSQTLTKPSLDYPSNGATVASPVGVMWNSVATATQYRLQISSDDNFMTNIYVDEYTSSTLRSSISLNAGQYWWHVKAKNATDSSIWSDAWRFIVGSATPILTVNPPQVTVPAIRRDVCRYCK